MINDPLPATLRLRLYRGDTRIFSVKFEDDADPPVARDLTGYTFTAKIKAEQDDAEAMAVFACTVPTPSDGVVVLTLTADEAAKLVPDKAHWDLQSAKGADVRTWLTGEVTIRPDVS